MTQAGGRRRARGWHRRPGSAGPGCALLLACCLLAARAGAQSPAPAAGGRPAARAADFAAYPGEPAYRGRPAMPDFAGRDRGYATYRTRLRQAIAQGPDFDGHWRVVQIGCGTGCRVVYVADVATGRILRFPHGGEDDYELDLDYRPDSALIRAVWMPDPGGDTCRQEDLVLKGDRFVAAGPAAAVPCSGGR